MTSNIKFKVGDIIHQTRDNIIFLVVAISQRYVHLEYDDRGQLRSLQMQKSKIREQISENLDKIKYYHVNS